MVLIYSKTMAFKGKRVAALIGLIVFVTAVTTFMNMSPEKDNSVNSRSDERFSNARFSNARFSNARFSNFKSPHLKSPNHKFSPVNPPNARFPNVNPPNARFPNANPPNAGFPNGNPPNAGFPNVKSPNVKFPAAKFPDIKETKSQTRPLKDFGPSHDKWIVLTTIAPPTEDVKFLASMQGWKVVVVGDTKTPDDWSFPNCEYLSVKQQNELGLISTDYTPVKSYTRKNIGYLYAMQRGAKLIYETDDDNRPMDKLLSFDYDEHFTGLEITGKSKHFNPYHHFGQSTLWPRGYPLTAIGEDAIRIYRTNGAMETPLIQQGIVNGDPDMDAIFRLTRKRVGTDLDVHFDSTAPTAVLPEGVFSPFNSQNTLFHQNAFWGMFLPTTTTMRVCDIWRGYWVQRLLWEIGGRVAFYPPNAYQKRNSHSYLDDAIEEEQMYETTEKLIDFLRDWECRQSLTFFGCVEALITDLAGAEYLGYGDVEVTKAWLQDLVRIGYKEPPRVKNGKADQTPAKLPVSPYPKCQEMATYKDTDVVFYPTEQESPMLLTRSLLSMPKILRHAGMVADVCPYSQVLSNGPVVTKASNGTTFFNDTLVIVSFDNPEHYSKVRYLEAAYRAVFPNMVYCGSNRRGFQDAVKGVFGTERLSFIEAGVTCGHLAYACTLGAMRAGYNVKGYLQFSHDSVINPWSFENLNKGQPWMVRATKQSTSGTVNWWWETSMGQKAYTQTMQDLANSQPPSGVEPAKQLLDRNAVAAGSGSLMIGKANVYYIPERLEQSAMWYLSMFYDRVLFHEIAVPLLIYGLESPSKIEFITGKSLSSSETRSRADAWKQYDPQSHFLYPVTMGSRSSFESFCSKFVPAVMKMYAQRRP